MANLKAVPDYISIDCHFMNTDETFQKDFSAVRVDGKTLHKTDAPYRRTDAPGNGSSHSFIYRFTESILIGHKDLTA